MALTQGHSGGWRTAWLVSAVGLIAVAMTGSTSAQSLSSDKFKQIIKENSLVAVPTCKFKKLKSGCPKNLFQLTQDYTVDLKKYFTIAATLRKPPGLPKRFRRNSKLLKRMAKHVTNLPRKEWKYGLLEKGGVLTIKKGYRWDGMSFDAAPKGVRGRTEPRPVSKGLRASLVHDALYDLMRLRLLKPPAKKAKKEKGGEETLALEGHRNRLMTDATLYAIGSEDGWATKRLQKSYDWLRLGGGRRTREEMPAWK